MTNPIRRAIRRLVYSPIVRRPISDAFHLLWYYADNTWRKNTFMGYTLLQCPLDLHLYQELIYRVAPPFIVQTGVAAGGSLFYFATLLDLAGAPPDAVVIGIDITLTESAKSLTHPRIRLVEGSSTDLGVVECVRSMLPAAAGFVVLDSDHSRDHVLSELSIYGQFVSVGSYIVVEDTNINGHPVRPFWGPGPFEAVQAFLQRDDRFVRDDDVWRRNLVSFHQRGWLRRVR